MKLRIPIEQLCFGLPSTYHKIYNITFITLKISFFDLIFCLGEFSSYLNYCRSLRFEDRPDYSHLRKMFKELLVKDGYEYDYAYDWVIMNDKLINQGVLTMVDNGDEQD